MRKIHLIFLIAFFLVGCGTTLGDFQNGVAKLPEYRFCTLAVQPISGGLTDAVRTSRYISHSHCSNNVGDASRNALSQCSSKAGRQCMVAYVYDRQTNRFDSMQSKNIAGLEAERKNSLVQKCDGYGFKRGTLEHSNCMMNVEQQMEATETAWRIEQNKIQQQNLDRLRQVAKDLNPPIQQIQPVCPQVLNAQPGQYPCR